MREVKSFDIDGAEFEVWENSSGDGEYVLYEDYAALEQRAEAAEAKLADLDKEEPVSMRYRWCPPHMKEEDGSAWIGEWKYCDLGEANPRKDYERQELFTRPAPAAELAELIEGEETLTAGVDALVDCLEDCGDAEQGLRLALRAILRKIEDAK